MADTKLSQETWGRVTYVEPTNVRVETFEGENHLINTESNEAILNPLEDYCIAVDLEVCIPDRRSCGFADKTGEAVYMEFSSTKKTISFMNGTNGTLTTNFTDVSSLKPNDSTAECLGIESIDITYDSWMYPQVTIRFVDVRGAALMMPEEDSFQNKHDYIRSVYTSLFSVPYPVFKLKVKGFYGLGTTYYLCPEDTHIELDSTTGNFILTVKFIGQKFKIYADLPMAYICVAPYMAAGEEYWKNQCNVGPFKFKNRDNSETSMMTFVDLRRKVADALHSEDQQKMVENRVKTESDYKRKESLLGEIRISPTLPWKIAEDGRCYRIIKSQKSQAKEIAESIKTYLEKVEKYDKDFTKEGSTPIAPNFECLKPYVDAKQIVEITHTQKKWSDSKFLEDSKNTEIAKYAINYAAELAKMAAEKNETRRETKAEVKFSLLVLNTDKAGIDKLNNCIGAGGLIETELTKAQKEREKVVSEMKDSEKLSIEAAIGFTPSIQNVFNLAFAHMDTFMHCFYQYMDNIKQKMDSKDVSRLISTFANSNEIASDVKAKTEGELGNDVESLPPFPGFYKYADSDKSGKGPMEQMWLEDLTGGASFDEVAFVNDLITASKTYFKKSKEVDELIAEYKKNEEEKEGGESTTEEETTEPIEETAPAEVVQPEESPITKIDKFIPITTFDLAKKESISNPYSYISSHAYSDAANGVGSIGVDILTTFMIRALYYFSTNEVPNKVDSDKDRNTKMTGDADAFGDAEAVNFAKAIKENFATPSLRDFILMYGKEKNYNGEDVFNYIIGAAKLKTGEDGVPVPIFGVKNDLVSFDFPAAMDKATDEPNRLPIGEGAISQFGGQILAGKDKNNANYLPERESATTAPKQLTFFIKKDRNYLSKIYENLRRVALGISADSEEEKKYKIKSINVAKEIADNTNSIFREDSAIMNGVFCRREPLKKGEKEKDLWTELKNDLSTGTVDSIIKKYAVKLPFKPLAFSDSEQNNLFKQNSSQEALAYLLLLGLNTVTPTSSSWQKLSGIQYESTNGVVPKFALLKEGALYWREQYMSTHNGQDPIVHDTFKDATANEMYSYERVSLDKPEYADDYYENVAKDTCVGGIPLNSKTVFYTKWLHPKNLTASRKKVLIDLFLEWAKTEAPDGVTLGRTKQLYKVESLKNANDAYDTMKRIAEEQAPGTDKDDIVALTMAQYASSPTREVLTPYLDLGYLDDKNEKSKKMLGGGVDIGPNIKIKDLAERLQSFLMHVYFDMYTVFDLYAGRAPMKANRKDDYTTCKFYAGKEPLKKALTAFMKALGRMYKEEIKDQFVQAAVEQEKKIIIEQEDPFKNKDLRLATYQTLKALYDKWLCAPFHGEETWQFLGPNVAQENSNEKQLRSEFTNFIYMDSFYRRIGKNLLTNISTVADWLGKCLPNIGNESERTIAATNSTSVYDFLWGIAESVGGTLLQIPQSMAIRDEMSVAQMFTPYSFNDDWQRDSTSFVFIYSYKPSEHLGTNQYPDDGFQIRPEISTFINTNQDGYKIPAFGVTYGKQNQSIFKNITLTTQSSNVTEAAIVSMMAIASKGSTGARESRFLGQDLYKVKTAYAYQCEFDMMGCGQIMPLMYFQLNNIPFWRGAYMIIKVKHQISQGDMVTHVTGVRINKYMLPWIEGELALADDYVPGTGGSVTTHTISAQKAGTSKDAKVDVLPNPKATLPATDNVWTFKEGNISEQKPIISIWPAHGPKTYKSCEWAWSSQLIDDYIIPLLKVFDFADGTSFENNIQRCNVNGAHTGENGYSSIQTQNLVSKYGSKQVISLVPHWNALDDKKTNPELNGKLGQYFLVMPGWYRKGDKNDEVRRADSTKFAFYAAREAWKTIDRKGEFTKMPTDAIGSIGGDRNKTDFPIKKGSVQVQCQMPGSSEDSNGNTVYSTFADPAYVPKCAAILTENWFRTYRPGNPTPPLPTSSKDEWEKDTTRMDLVDGKYKTMQAWLWSEEGSTAIGYLNAMAIVNYIASLGEKNGPTVNENRLKELEKKNSYLVEKFRKWFADANK